LRTDFSGSAENINFNIEGDNVPILRASLGDGEGGWQDRDVNLAERIGNEGGNFVFSEQCS
jgi:hypothetical protein